MSSAAAELSEPIEFLDLEHNHSIELAIQGYQQGVVSIHPRQVTQRHVRIYMDQNNLTEPPAAGTPITVQIPVLRVVGMRMDMPSPNTYWDISSKRLQADLVPRLQQHQNTILRVKITASGEKPTKQFSVEQGG
jgi:hypothetical protein